VQICYDRHTAKHLGYAISHFDHPAAAQYAIDTLHNFKLHGRHIVVAPYRTKVKDASALHACPPQCSPPAANEAVAVVMNLSKNATWMYDFFM
jgi:RNA recognition motif-containing protein